VNGGSSDETAGPFGLVVPPNILRDIWAIKTDGEPTAINHKETDHLASRSQHIRR
jgi:hypothetical protein